MIEKQSGRRGLLIAVEGGDRCGKSTQCAYIASWLSLHSRPSVCQKFPDRTTPIGTVIDEYLKNDISTLNDHSIHLLFSANRWELAENIASLIRSGTTVICDRYVPSGIAYTAAKGLDAGWCAAPDHGLPKPDVIIYLDVPVEVAAERSSFGEERYERIDFQRRVRGQFMKLKGEDGTWVVIDAQKNTNDVSAAIGEALLPVLTKETTELQRSANNNFQGETLASAGDGGVVILWSRQQQQPSPQQSAHSEYMHPPLDDNEENGGDVRERWAVKHMIRVADTEDIYDLDFSPDGSFLIIGLTDNSAQVWDLANYRQIKVLKDHKHFVQGVGWDPLGQYAVTQSCDRSVKIWGIKPRKAGALSFTAVNRYSKGGTLFQDESCVSFFRRLSFSPDGALLFMPVGLDQSTGKPALHVATRNTLTTKTPLFSLASFDKPVIAVRSCPVFYELCNPEDGGKLLCLPYRMIFAVMTLDKVFIFDTEHREPLWSVSGLHYAALTDVSWSCDGRFLMVTSVDGFCSLLRFDPQDVFSHPIERPLARGNYSSVVPSSEPDIPMAPLTSSLPSPNNNGAAVVNQLVPKKRSMLASGEAIVGNLASSR